MKNDDYKLFLKESVAKRKVVMRLYAKMKNKAAVGDALGISRERVRQIVKAETK